MKEVFVCHIFAMMLAFLMDQVVGDPHGLFHPVCWIGKCIKAVEEGTRGWFSRTKSGERIAGFFLVVIVLAVSVLIPYSLLRLAYRIHFLAGIFVEMVLLCYMLAARSLTRESMAVGRALETKGLEAGRQAVSMIVGRDTQVLDETGVIKATVETVAENTCDGVIAPLFYMLFGLPFVYGYKAVNTMDSMVGYKNEAYQYYGTCAAKLDDVLNFIPARISAGLLLFATWICGMTDRVYNVKVAFTIFRRDRMKHASPNSAQTESVIAGALQIQLAGPGSYFGKQVDKPYIGDPHREAEREDIKRVNRLMQVAAWTFMLAVCMLFFISVR